MNLLIITSILLFGSFQLSNSAYEPNWDSLETRPVPEWFDQAKIGIFIHWGVFSVPSMGTEWFWPFWNDGGEVTQYLEDYFPPNFSYQEFAKDFTAEFFNASEWAELFEKAGAKYVVLTSKHHEGYTLFPSEYSYSWNSKDVGPHRDLAGELGEAVRNRNVTYGLYYSLMEWYHPLYKKSSASDWSDKTYAEQKAIPELKELINLYEPAIIWSDGDWEAPDTYWNSTDFIAWLYNESPVKDFVVINDRWGSNTVCVHGGYLTCQDRYTPTEIPPRKWENAMSLDRVSYGYRRNAKLDDYLSIDELLSTVIHTIAYGGNILINIGPAHDGTINLIFQERLLQLGEWLRINGEAIYESQPIEEFQQDTLNDNIYYTKRDGNYYVLFMEWLNTLKFQSIGDLLQSNSGAEITLLGNDGALSWKVEDGVVEVNLPDFAIVKSSVAWVLKINIVKNA